MTRWRRSACSSATASASGCTSGRSSAGSTPWSIPRRSRRAWSSRWRPTARPRTASRRRASRRRWSSPPTAPRCSRCTQRRSCQLRTPTDQEAPPVEELLELFERMAVIRATEKAAYDLFMSGLVKGTTHLAAGHEAVAVGASAALRPDDYVFATYRGHHHAIARGATPEACLAELMSRATGLNGAKGGSMHLTVASSNMLGSYAIVGAHLPIAWGAKLRNTGQVAVAFFGDGATNIGAFHEALNLAAVWRLPVLFVCENNLYMEY